MKTITVIIGAVLAVTLGTTSPPFTGVQSTTSPPSTGGHTQNSLLYNLLQAAGFTDSCVSGVLDHCSSVQEQVHFPSLIQEVQEVKVEVQDVKVAIQEVKDMVQEIMLVVLKNESVMAVLKNESVLAVLKNESVLAELNNESVLALLKNESVVAVLKNESVVTVLKKMFRPRHCKDLLDSGDTESGPREVYPYSKRPNHTATVYCDQDVDGGGWTVFQRRTNTTVRLDFTRNWTEYEGGFGDVNGEFWLGLDILHQLTTSDQELRIDLDDYEGEHRWAKYGTFRVASADSNYRLTVDRYSGDAGDSMGYHNGLDFSTHDSDHDRSSINCAKVRRGGWWYSNCHNANLNGYQYVGNDSTIYNGIIWYHWQGWYYSLRRTTMMIRPTL